MLIMLSLKVETLFAPQAWLGIPRKAKVSGGMGFPDAAPTDAAAAPGGAAAVFADLAKSIAANPGLLKTVNAVYQVPVYSPSLIFFEFFSSGGSPVAQLNAI